MASGADTQTDRQTHTYQHANKSKLWFKNEKLKRNNATVCILIISYCVEQYHKTGYVHKV